MREINDDLFNKIATWTGQPIEKIIKDANRDYWMTAKEAVEQGVGSVDRLTTLEIAWGKREFEFDVVLARWVKMRS
jgi:ATP-dependent protease ClpP protease subunit